MRVDVIWVGCLGGMEGGVGLAGAQGEMKDTEGDTGGPERATWIYRPGAKRERRCGVGRGEEGIC